MAILNKNKNKKRLHMIGFWQKISVLNSSFLVLFFGASIGVYIFQVNVATLEGYKLQEKKIKLETLQDQYYSLLAQDAGFRSMERIGYGVDGLDMEELGEVTYISADGLALAKR